MKIASCWLHCTEMLDENKNTLPLLLQDIQKLLKQEWKGVYQSIQVSWNTVISWFHAVAVFWMLRVIFYSFGLFPGVWCLIAYVSELCVCSVLIGEWIWSPNPLAYKHNSLQFFNNNGDFTCRRQYLAICILVPVQGNIMKPQTHDSPRVPYSDYVLVAIGSYWLVELIVIVQTQHINNRKYRNSSTTATD
jgi:hypothetical protein